MAETGGMTGGAYASPSPSPSKPTKRQSAADVAKAFAAAAGGHSSLSSKNDPPVYMGAYRGTGEFAGDVSDRVDSLSEAQAQFYGWDDRTRSKFVTQLSLAGYNASGLTDSDLAKAWGAYTEQAASYYAQGKKLTPWDILAKDRRMRENAPPEAPRTVTSTETNADLSTRQDAHALFLQAAQQLLGRDPTAQEIKGFQSTLNAYEKANPVTRTTVSKYQGQDLQSQKSTTQGGVSAEAKQLMASQDIKKDPEFGAYQAATTYFDAMMQMIGG